jgi:hypothetical protein
MGMILLGCSFFVTCEQKQETVDDSAILVKVDILGPSSSISPVISLFHRFIVSLFHCFIVSLFGRGQRS